ncbi:MAG: prephenate dehydrogenase/arogenate dehydrogenase family protein [Actinobacteria bacterium HGW-Actinobacteria-7]|jgi:prephenate dehydrogenase|nr:MAG: prephenate dehydrogenase/arogenate dehydrogenase family protein [Actinobacteria bacterium HGW-Actinobacteria-7]
MSTSFSRVTVIGIGLIGGSLARALKNLPHAPEVRGIDVDPESLAWAVDNGVIDSAASPGSDAARLWLDAGGSDLVVIATPARFAAGWLSELGIAGFDGVVTDVASTKSGVLSAATSLLAQPTRFVGGHPMAGSERSGVTAARADLFAGAYWLLTPAADTDPDAYRAVHALVSAIGARVISVDAEAHDQAVAIVSHVPHVAAAALVDLASIHAGEGGELMRLAAGGFKDTTRIAAGSPELWTGICLDNADALAGGLAELRGVLRDFEVLVRSRDAVGITTWLSSAADVRRSLPAQWVPATSALTELVVPMDDRPGVVAAITSAVSRAGCNIEGIDIDHETEDRALLVLVLTDEGDLDRLSSDLERLGFETRFTPLAETGEDQ